MRKTFTQRFGGVTAFTRAPAEGVFKDSGKEVHDDVVLIEVMAEALDREVWARYRKHLEQTFGQDEIPIRATPLDPTLPKRARVRGCAGILRMSETGY